MSLIVTKQIAHAAPERHQFVSGIGYLPHTGPPELPHTAQGRKNCVPPAGTLDDTLHKLVPPTGGKPLWFRWRAVSKVWMSTTPAQGNRLGWPAAHLMRAGWEYGGAI